MNSAKKMANPTVKLIRFESADVIATSIPAPVLGDHEMIIPMGQAFVSPNPMASYQEPISQ